ncbi:unnamed protein product [Paramecium sonneborni]|uniref:Uncharacterized protein n=1 Tax=Paramecium sonneborni TaxID=65129 RepID=A0A8S1RBL2_9CILI|nr:unnamed protein product [Paramecium sonneborni]
MNRKRIYSILLKIKINLNKPKNATNPEECYKIITFFGKEAFTKEMKFRLSKEVQHSAVSINTILSYCAALTQTFALNTNGLQNAFSKFQEIIKFKQYPQQGRLNSQYGMKYSSAIKIYEIALD